MNTNNAHELVQSITNCGINGVWPMCSAEDLAREFLVDPSYGSRKERVDSLIRWQCARNFGSGFVTSVGGPISMAVGIPVALGASWLIQARMSAAIAYIYGHNIKSDRVQTFVLLTILGDEAVKPLKKAGIVAGKKLTLKLINRIPAETIKKINEKVGFRLLTRAGEQGVINFTKVVPVVGGVIGGTFDASCCYTVGQTAKLCFRRKKTD